MSHHNFRDREGCEEKQTERTLWKVDLSLRNQGDTGNYGDVGYADGPGEGAEGAGRGRYWMNVSGYVAKYLTLS